MKVQLKSEWDNQKIFTEKVVFEMLDSDGELIIVEMALKYSPTRIITSYTYKVWLDNKSSPLQIRRN